MNGYIINFTVYTLAMIGFIVLALYVYKKSTYFPNNAKNNVYLKVENTLRLSPTKTIYAIKAGNEKFLIAADASTTTMLAKLENSETEENVSEINSDKEYITKETTEELINRG